MEQNLKIIPNRWYGIFASKKLLQKPIAITRFGEKLVLFRTQNGTPVCFVDRCPHRGVALSLGRVRGDTLECRYHGFCFDKQGNCTRMPCEGENVQIPLNMKAVSFPLRENYGIIWLWWGAESSVLERNSFPEIPWFSEIPSSERFAHGGSYEWPINCSRALEANFDSHHAPFVHGFGKLRQMQRMDSIEVTVTGEQIELRGEMREEKRSLSEKDLRLPFHVLFHFPGLSYLRIGSLLNFVVIDTPIDTNRTWRYSRFFNEFAKLPVLGKAIAYLIRNVDLLMTQKLQDLVIVKTQKPKQWKRGCDVLVRSDQGIATYLNLRETLLQQEKQRAHLLPEIVQKYMPT